MRIILSATFCMLLSCTIAAQTDTIKWNWELSWEQLKLKAGKDGKAIFLDCYATWCRPCKLMDKEVFTKKNVIDYLNKNYVCAKMQMDTTNGDAEYIQKRYNDSKCIQLLYDVKVLPSYLFFTSDGKVTHKVTGAIRDSAFLQILANALNPEKQYFTLKELFQNGIINHDNSKYLAKCARSLGEIDFARLVARDYLDNFLYRNQTEIFQKGNIEFIGTYLECSNEKGFEYFFKHTDTINKIVGVKGFAEKKISDIVTKEEITAHIWVNNKPVNNTPNWRRITAQIKSKYGKKYARSVVPDAQINWFSYHKDWANLIQAHIQRIERDGIDTSSLGRTYFNNDIWDVFVKHADSRKALKKAIGWMETVLEAEPNVPEYIDTYANLLFKIGRTKDAIEMQEKALSLKPDDAEIKETLSKMKNGQIHW